MTDTSLPRVASSTRRTRELAAARSAALRERVGRLYSLVDGAEWRAAVRHREVLHLQDSAAALCRRAALLGWAATPSESPPVQGTPDRDHSPG